MDFSKIKSFSIPEGVVKKIQVNGITIWGEPTPPLAYKDLVPTALNIDGTILDGVGYRRGYYWNVRTLTSASAFSAIGLISLNGTIQHDIYVYGINFTGTARNRYYLYGETFNSLAETLSIKEGFSNTYISSITKLSDNYFKITTKTYSTKVKYFGISGVTVDGIIPVVTIDEPIFN